jgi:hypothetical protein
MQKKNKDFKFEYLFITRKINFFNNFAQSLIIKIWWS